MSASPSRDPSSRPLLEVGDLTVVFQPKGEEPTTAVDGVSFAVAPGRTVGLVGESGCGKSVTALAIMGLLPRRGARVTGSVRFEGTELLGLSDSAMCDRRGRDLAMVFQDPLSSLNPVVPIGLQVTEVLERHRGLSRKKAMINAVELLTRVGIPDPRRRLDEYSHQLSGGMRQRALIAMALACRPRLLITDEPTTALDVTIQAQILTIVSELVREQQAALILITHDLGVVAGMCERVNVMYGGMFVETGEARQLFARPRHPYTLGLLQSVPRLDAGRRQQLQPIEGVPRDQLSPPTACPFQPRCRYEVEQSREEVPPLVEIEPGHQVACFNPVPADEWQSMRAAALG